MCQEEIESVKILPKFSRDWRKKNVWLKGGFSTSQSENWMLKEKTCNKKHEDLVTVHLKITNIFIPSHFTAAKQCIMQRAVIEK